MTAPVDLHEAAANWQRLVDFARERGWSADLTASGKLRLEKSGSVLFGPGIGGSLEALREVARRIIHAEHFAEQHGARWQP